MHPRPAKTEDLETIITWIAVGEDCRTWAGPMVRFPMTVRSLKADIGFEEDNTYCLDQADRLAAFGQLIRKSEFRLHMARFIVAPGKRASGIGRQWCRELMALAWKKGCETITLNVYRQNVPAVKLYTAAGFSEVAAKSTAELCHMIVHSEG